MTIELPDDSGITLAGKLPQLHRDSWLEPPLVIQASLNPMNLIQIGAFTGIYGGKVGHCRIGRYCSIAPGVDIASDQHPVDWLSSSMLQYVPNIHGWGDWLVRHGEKYFPPNETFQSNSQAFIGNDVWIGQGVFIKSGIKIGDGSIIAAHSVVVTDIPPYSIAAGVPATVKRPRFSVDVIEKLLNLKWWDYNISQMIDMKFKNVSHSITFIENSIATEKLLRYSPAIYKEGF